MESRSKRDKRRVNRDRGKLRKAKKDAARGAPGALERVKLHQAKHDSNRAKQQVDDLQRHIHKASTEPARRTIGLPAKS
jgi:hypothetical protein